MSRKVQVHQQEQLIDCDKKIYTLSLQFQQIITLKYASFIGHGYTSER